MEKFLIKLIKESTDEELASLMDKYKEKQLRYSKMKNEEYITTIKKQSEQNYFANLTEKLFLTHKLDVEKAVIEVFKDRIEIKLVFKND
jgi:hypothetical protein